MSYITACILHWSDFWWTDSTILNGTRTGHRLVFTTHDTSILSQDVFRRDQIWFCERNARQETNLFPLTNFRPRRGVENLERAYLGGRYGAVPYVRHSRVRSDA